MHKCADRRGMKRSLFISILLVSGVVSAAAASFSVGIGSEFLNYDTIYLTTQASFINEITDNVELETGGVFGIRVEEQQPGFYLPLQIGLGFLFPDLPVVDGMLGVGLTPAFNWGAGVEGVRFYLGPHLKAGIRVPVHPFMRWYLEAQQHLLIGPPHWINNSTRVSTGINFFFGGSD